MSSPTFFRPRGNTATSTSSSSYGYTYDEDAITPCPPHSQPNLELAQADDAQVQHHQRRTLPAARRQRPTSWRSTLSSSDGSETADCPVTHAPAVAEEEQVDPETLWRRMLALQRIFGCYNSARMRAALDSGDEAFAGVPPRTCLDLLNDSIDTLPEEERKQLEEFLQTNGGSAAGKRRSWRERLVGVSGGWWR